MNLMRRNPEVIGAEIRGTLRHIVCDTCRTIGAR